jgi:hypothetical protein
MSANGQPPEAPASEPAESGVQTDTPTTEAPQSDGLDRLYSRMDEMAATQREFMESVAQQLRPPEEEEDEADYYDDTGEMTEAGARAFIKELVDEQVQAQLGPREARRLVEQRDDAYEALKDEYPELADEKTAGPVLQAAIAWARENGLEEIIDRPQFVDVIEWHHVQNLHHAHREASDEAPPRSVVLESASGAARQQRQPTEPDWQKRVIEAAQADGPRI